MIVFREDFIYGPGYLNFLYFSHVMKSFVFSQLLAHRPSKKRWHPEVCRPCLDKHCNGGRREREAEGWSWGGERSLQEHHIVKNNGHNPHYDLGAVLRPFKKSTESIQQAATISPFERQSRKNNSPGRTSEKGPSQFNLMLRTVVRKTQTPPWGSLARWFSKCGPQTSSTWEMVRKFSAPPRPTVRVAPASSFNKPSV